MELRDYLRVLRAHWTGVVLLTLLAIGLAATYTYSQPKEYAADATGYVSVGAGDDAALASVDDAVAKSKAKAYVTIAEGRAVAQRVITKLSLDTDPSSLAGHISVDQPTDSNLLVITARSSSPHDALVLADAWVTALAAEVADIEGTASSPSGGSIGIKSIESAALPNSPVSPRPPLNLAIGLVLGLLIGLAYAVIRSQLDRRLRSPEEVERRFGVPIVGRVPISKRIDGIETGSQSATGDASHSWGASESFRKLRTNLAYMDVDAPPQIIVVTSPSPADGKSTVASNLAAAIAIGGTPVTLVDGDLRRPTVADSLGLIDGVGLTDVLIGKADVDDVLQTHTSLEQLSVLAAGSTPPNPSELLGSKAMQTLLGKLAARGVVIIDAPPLLPVTDAAVLTRHADGAIVVVSYGRTLDRDLAQSLSQLRTVQGRVLGIVINRVPRRDREGGYYGEYYSTGNARKTA